jgi:DNA primase
MYNPPEQLDQLRDSRILQLNHGSTQINIEETSVRLLLSVLHDDNNLLVEHGTRGIYKCFSCGAGGNVLTLLFKNTAN